MKKVYIYCVVETLMAQKEDPRRVKASNTSCLYPIDSGFFTLIKSDRGLQSYIKTLAFSSFGQLEKDYSCFN